MGNSQIKQEEDNLLLGEDISEELIEVIKSFKKVKNEKESVISWIKETFPEEKTDEGKILIEYLSRKEVILKEIFYRCEFRTTRFYFRVYDKRMKDGYLRRIAFRV